MKLFLSNLIFAQFVYVDALWPTLNPLVIINSAAFGTGISCQHTHPVLIKSEGVRACIYCWWTWSETLGKPSHQSADLLTRPWSEVLLEPFTVTQPVRFNIPHGSALLVPCWRGDLIYISFMWPLLIHNVLRSQSTQIYISLFIHRAAFPVTFRLEIAAFLRPSFKQLSQTPEYEAVCAISHRRACHSMFSVHINSSARSVWAHLKMWTGLDVVCRLLSLRFELRLFCEWRSCCITLISHRIYLWGELTAEGMFTWASYSRGNIIALSMLDFCYVLI